MNEWMKDGDGGKMFDSFMVGEVGKLMLVIMKNNLHNF